MADLSRPIRSVARAAASATGALPAQTGQIGRLLRAFNIWFWAIVGVPTLIAGVYYFGVASNQYVSEAKFVVGGPNKPAATAGSLASLFGGGGLQSGGDAAVVREFILSRDAVRDLEQHDDLRAVLSRPEGDLLTRFPGLEYWRTDFEALYNAYRRFVTIEVDDASGIATLQVKAYRPEDAQRINTALVKYAEALVNQLNERASADSLATFENAVHDAEQHIAQTQTQLTAYRIKQQMLDPKAASDAALKLVSDLEKELAAARGQLADMVRNAPRSPGILLLRTRITSLQQLIADERATVTGNTNSVATKSTEFDRLGVQRTLYEKALASAYTSLEAARLQAQRQALYLDEIAQPNLPDYPLFPKRFQSFALVVASCFLAYGIAWLLMAGVREHGSA